MNILLSSYDFHEPWAHEIMKSLLHPGMKVIVIPFSFENDLVKTKDDYDQHYGIQGKHVPYILRPFHYYGITDITFIDYFRDSHELAKEKVKQADIIFLTGGLPDQYLQRLEEFELIASLKESQAIFIGASAGAMVQLDTYHITPDNDYPKYQYGKGIGLVSGFEIEVHYCHSLAQDEGIQRVIAERHLPTYTIANDGGLLVSGQQRICFGHAKQVY